MRVSGVDFSRAFQCRWVNECASMHVCLSVRISQKPNVQTIRHPAMNYIASAQQSTVTKRSIENSVVQYSNFQYSNKTVWNFRSRRVA